MKEDIVHKLFATTALVAALTIGAQAHAWSLGGWASSVFSSDTRPATSNLVLNHVTLPPNRQSMLNPVYAKSYVTLPLAVKQALSVERRAGRKVMTLWGPTGNRISGIFRKVNGAWSRIPNSGATYRAAYQSTDVYGQPVCCNGWTQDPDGSFQPPN
jgi:hypothetical protein